MIIQYVSPPASQKAAGSSLLARPGLIRCADPTVAEATSSGSPRGPFCSWRDERSRRPDNGQLLEGMTSILNSAE